MLETMSDTELDDALRASQERLRQVLNEQHRRRTISSHANQPTTMGSVARQAALNALRADRKSVLAFAAIVVLMVGVALANALKALVGP